MGECNIERNIDFIHQKNNFDLNHVKIVLKCLAKFHSKSVNNKATSSNWIDLKNNHVTETIRSIFGNNSSKIIEHFDDKQNANFRRSLCHANLISKNILFKYEAGVPVEVKLINGKKISFSPVNDVLQLLYFNTNENFRQEHFEDILLYYHDCLPQNFLPFEQLRKEAHHFLPIIKLQKVILLRSDPEELREVLACPFLSKEDCYSIVKKKIGSTNYKFLSFSVTPLDKTNGYLGSYHKLKIRFLHPNEEEMNCFIKTVPKGTSSKMIVQDCGCWFKEAFVFQTLIPKIEKLGINAITECLPEAYFQRSEELIVMEDVCSKGYSSLSPMIPYNAQTLSVCLKKLAKFHASMLAFEEKMSEELKTKFSLGETYADMLEESFYTINDRAGSKLMQTGFRSIPVAMKLFPELKTQQNEDNFRKMQPKLHEIFFSVVKPSKVFRNVLSHGDLWNNNIMLKLEDGKAIDCRFVDYQIIRYCPPAQDFLSLLYLTTDRKTRIGFEEEAKAIYYKQLEETLKLYGYQAEKILPYEEFLQSIDLMRPQMIAQAIIYKMFIVEPEDIASFLGDEEVSKKVFFEDREEYLTKICQKSSVVRNSLKEGITDLYEFCNTFNKN